MKHFFQRGSNETTFVLLHGTGGTEHDLLRFAETIDPNANFLGIRGEVTEKGQRRFFRRLAEGVYDLEDLDQRGQELFAFIEEASENYGFDLEMAVPFGFSNGANIGIHLLFNSKNAFDRAVLLAPMYPVEIEQAPDLSRHQVFLSMGKKDPIVSQEESERVIRFFEDFGADVKTFWVNGHEITHEMMVALKDWYQNK